MPPRRRQSDAHTEHDDPAFTALPARLQRKIDRAFDNARNPSGGPLRKRRKLDGKATSESPTIPAAPGGFIVDNPQPGGFLVEEDTQPGGFVIEKDIQPGGFVVEEHEGEDTDMDNNTASAEMNEDENKISLSLIPHALQLLDLQPDDEDVLGVFRHAASGWEDKSRSTARSEISDEQYVSRKDWRAVCAALLDADVGDEEDPSQSRAQSSKHASDEGGDLTPLESSDSGDEYQGSEPDGASSEAGDDASDDEYQEGGFIAPKRKGKSAKSTPTRTRPSRKSGRSPSASSSDDDSQGTRPLTARQRLECRRAFALFFPSVPDAQLDKQRIMIKDITRVAKLLKEKITADEVSPRPSHTPQTLSLTVPVAQTVEMLEMFSTSADKSMSLSDFERMMMAAKLA